jgi:ABC-type Fe3+-siderophore transport system permease subunit
MTDKNMIWGAIVVSIVTVLGFVGLMALIILRATPFDEFQRHAIDICLGILGSGGVIGVIGFWLGSSSGSMMKTARLAEMDQRRDGPPQ